MNPLPTNRPLTTFIPIPSMDLETPPFSALSSCLPWSRPSFVQLLRPVSTTSAVTGSKFSLTLDPYSSASLSTSIPRQAECVASNISRLG